jgi:transcriptional antiterminator RfaH
MKKEWFILQVKPNSHFKALNNLKRQGFETFLPLENSTLRTTSRFINSNKPLFPGYMFIAFDRTSEPWSKINNTYGVSRLITFNSILQSVPSSLIDAFRQRCDLSDKLLSKKKLKKGDQVRVLKGPFASLIATVETCEKDQRIWVLMDLMGRKTLIQTPLDTIQPSN